MLHIISFSIIFWDTLVTHHKAKIKYGGVYNPRLNVALCGRLKCNLSITHVYKYYDNHCLGIL